MLLEAKRPLTAEEIDSQAAIELPERDTLLVTVVLTNILSGNRVTITVRNVDIAAQICAAVLTANTNVTCEIQQP